VAILLSVIWLLTAVAGTFIGWELHIYMANQAQKVINAALGLNAPKPAVEPAELIEYSDARAAALDKQERLAAMLAGSEPWEDEE